LPGTLAAPRHVAAWADLTAAEQFTLLARLGEALAAGLAGFAVATDSVDLAVAFAMGSGVRLIAPWFRDPLDRGGRLRVVVGDYMEVTEPAALSRLPDHLRSGLRAAG
jgi:HKD family nuclease